MQVTTELRPMFTYSFWGIIVVIGLIIGILLTKKYHRPKKINREIIIPNHNNLIAIKNKYLQELYKLTNDFKNEKVSNRQAYQILSSIVRNFIYEATNIKVQNYTLKDISMINMPILYELVSEYYDPEFSKISRGNIMASIDKTRTVIERWN